jgi:predicted membrane protein
VVDSEDLAIPALLILGGLIIMIKPRKKKHCIPGSNRAIVSENAIHTNIVFGGRKEIITSKDFKGGTVTAVFGGCEINLLQADSLDSQIVLDIRATFGGCEIIVPSHWDVKNEIEPVFGSVEDQRTIRTQEANEGRKTLVLQGSCVFGGIEIKSF